VAERAVSAITADEIKRILNQIFEKFIVVMVHDDHLRIRGFGSFTFNTNNVGSTASR